MVTIITLCNSCTFNQFCFDKAEIIQCCKNFNSNLKENSINNQTIMSAFFDIYNDYNPDCEYGNDTGYFIISTVHMWIGITRPLDIAKYIFDFTNSKKLNKNFIYINKKGELIVNYNFKRTNLGYINTNERKFLECIKEINEAIGDVLKFDGPRSINGTYKYPNDIKINICG